MLREVPAEKLGALVLNEVVKQANVKPAEVDDVFLSQAYANGETPNLARKALLEAGWPGEVPGVTVDRRCCGGVQSIWSGAMEIQTENAEIVVASGAESMSRAEFYIPGEYINGASAAEQTPNGVSSRGTRQLGPLGYCLFMTEFNAAGRCTSPSKDSENLIR